jgi:predicted Fe-Mo cluster-binding NifX family protein
VNVVIAATGPTLDSPVAKRFGHAPYYLIVNTATMQVQAIENNDSHDEAGNHGQHDESHAIIPQLVGQGAELFVTGNIGPHAFEIIQSLKRQVALARGLSASEALARLQRGELEILSAPTLKRSVHNHSQHSA